MGFGFSRVLGAAFFGLALALTAFAQTLPPGPRFDLSGYAVEGSPLLDSEDFSRIISPFIGRQKSAADVQKAQQNLQRAYLDLGHCSVQVTVPRTDPDSGVITFRLVQTPAPLSRDCLPMVVLGETRAAAPVAVRPGEASARPLVAVNGILPETIEPVAGKLEIVRAPVKPLLDQPAVKMLAPEPATSAPPLPREESTVGLTVKPLAEVALPQPGLKVSTDNSAPRPAAKLPVAPAFPVASPVVVAVAPPVAPEPAAETAPAAAAAAAPGPAEAASPEMQLILKLAFELTPIPPRTPTPEIPQSLAAIVPAEPQLRLKFANASTLVLLPTFDTVASPVAVADATQVAMASKVEAAPLPLQVVSEPVKLVMPEIAPIALLPVVAPIAASSLPAPKAEVTPVTVAPALPIATTKPELPATQPAALIAQSVIKPEPVAPAGRAEQPKSAPAAEAPKTATTGQKPPSRFDITGYGVEGSPLLDSADFSRIVSPFIGRQKSAADVQKAQQTLQQAYLDLGHCSVQVTVPRASPDAGVITFRLVPTPVPLTPNCLPMVALGATPAAPPVGVMPGEVATRSPEVAPVVVAPKPAPAPTPPVVALAPKPEPASPIADAPPKTAIVAEVPKPAVAAEKPVVQSAPTPAAAKPEPAPVEKKPAAKPPPIVVHAPAGSLQSTAPGVTTVTTAPDGTAAAAGPLKFLIERYVVRGNTLLKPDVISRVLVRYAGAQKDFGDVQRALEALQVAYQDAGYGAVQVTLPEQELDKGEVDLDVIETRLGKIDVQGNDFHDERNVRNSLPGFREGVTPNSLVIARSLRIANENASKQTQVALRAGTEDGEVDATIKVVDDSPIKRSISLDNTGGYTSGKFRTGFGFQHANMFNRDHVLTLQYVTSPEHPSAVAVLGLGYRVPLYRLGHSIDLIAGYSDVTSATVANLFNVSGAGTVFGARYNHNLDRSESYEHKITYGIDYRAFKNNVTFVTSTQPIVPDITVHPVSITYTGMRRTADSQLDFYGSYSQNIFPGGNDGSNSDFQGPSAQFPTGSRAGAKAGYNVIRAGANYTRLIWGEWQARGVFAIQQSDQALIAGEQFGAGGADSVRGFDERAFSNDRGYRGSLELYTPDMASAFGWTGGRIKFLVFYDTANLTRNFRQLSEQDGVSLDSMGFGLRLQTKNFLSLKADYATVVHDGGIGRRSSNTLHASMIIVF